MLRRFVEVLRIVFISPEIVATLIIALLFMYWPQPYVMIGSKFTSNSKLWEYIPVIPIGVFSFSIYLSFQLQAPVESANRELYDWELYWALKYRIIAAIFWAGSSVMLSLALWFISTELSNVLTGCIFIEAITLSVIVAATEIMALFTLKEILAK